MTTTPTQYRATDYPPKYRPGGYWRRGRRERPAAEQLPEPGRRRSRLWVLLAVLLATLVLHAGIAAAYLGSDSSTPVRAQQGQPADEGASCPSPDDAEAVDPNLNPEEDPNGVPTDVLGGDSGNGIGGGAGSARSAL